MDPMTLQRLANMRRDGLDAPESEETIDRLKHSIERFLNQVKKRSGGSGDCSQIASDQARRIRGLVRFDRLHRSSVLNGFEEAKAAISALKEAIPSGRGLRDSFWRVFLGWAMVCDIGRISSDCGYEQQSAAWMDEWVLGKIISRTFQSFGIDEATAWWETDLVKILVAHRGWFSSKRAEMRSNLKAPFFESHVQEFLQFNWHANVLWYNKERFEQLTDWLLVVSLVQLLAGDIELDGKMVEGIMDRYGVIQRVRQEAVRSQYRVDAMVDTLDRL
jgi:hypothetical protein